MESVPAEGRRIFEGIFGREGPRSAGEQGFGFGWEGAEPFAAQPVAEDVGQKQRPAWLDGPSLRDGVEAGQSVADLGDGGGELPAFFVLDADFDGALAAAAREPRDAVEQRGPARDGFAVVRAVVEPRVEVPPVVNPRDQAGHEPAGGELRRGVTAPAPLVLEFVADVLPAPSGAALRAKAPPFGYLAPLGSASARSR